MNIVSASKLSTQSPYQTGPHQYGLNIVPETEGSNIINKTKFLYESGSDVGSHDMLASLSKTMEYNVLNENGLR